MDTITHSLEMEIEQIKERISHLQDALCDAARRTQARFGCGPINAPDAEDWALFEEELEQDLCHERSQLRLLTVE